MCFIGNQKYGWYHTFLGGSTSTQSRLGVVEGTKVEAVVNGVVLGGDVVGHGLKFTST